MPVSPQKALYDALYEKARDGSPGVFKQLLEDFEHDVQAIKKFTAAINYLARTEDSGSYCEDASAGYGDYVRKEAILKEFLIDKARCKTRPSSKEKPATLDEIRSMMAELTRRLDRLEEANTPHAKNIAKLDQILKRPKL